MLDLFMDVYDSEPFLGLFPKKWLRVVAYGAFVTLMFFSSARVWLVNQAEQHVLHEVQPIIDELVRNSSSQTTTGAEP